MSIEFNKIYNGDCYELIKQVPDKSVDLIITDPPYEIIASGTGGCFGTEHRSYHHEYKTLGTEEHKREGLAVDSQSNANCVCTGFNYSLLNEFDRIMKKINIYIWCNKNQVSSLMKHYEEKGCNVDLLVWVKTNPLPTCKNKYLSDLEYCVFARDQGVGLGGEYATKSKAWISPCNTDDKKEYGHPTIKPLERTKQYIINSLGGGVGSGGSSCVVFDPFLGSGTTCVAAKELGYSYLGFELDKKFFQVACDRLNGINSSGQTSLDIFEPEQLSLFE